VCLSVCSVLSVLSVLSVCDVGVLWPNGWMDENKTWRGGRPPPRPHCVRWGPSSPTPKGADTQILAHVSRGQTVGWIKMPLGTEVGLVPGHIVLDVDPAPFPQKRHSPQFSAHVCCGQMAGWIKMPLGTEISLGSGDIVLYCDQAFPQRSHPPTFSAYVCYGQTAGWIKMPAGMEVGLGPGHNVFAGDPVPQRGAAAPLFRPMSIVAKRSPISATVQHLFK